MNAEQIAKLKELAQAATPGPWERVDAPKSEYWPAGKVVGSVHGLRRICDAPALMSDGENAANMAFIGAANPAAVLELIALAEKATPPVSALTYNRLLAIADHPGAHEALVEFSHDPTADNGVCVVRAILAAAAPAPADKPHSQFTNSENSSLNGDKPAPAIQQESIAPRIHLVPGKMHCARCKFSLIRKTLYVSSGDVGAGGNETEPCPNGCGPLWPVTWEQEARDGYVLMEGLLERAVRAEAALAQPVDLSKLTRYEFRTGFKTDVPAAGMLPEVLGTYAMFADVEQLIASLREGSK